jgi:hypothetical protein
MRLGTQPPRSLLLAALGVWFVAISVPLSRWTASHHALPGPVADTNETAAAQSATEWRAIHVLSSQCGCSELVAEHLIARRAQAGLEEHIWVVDGPAAWEARLSAAGFKVSPHTGESLAANTGIEGVPWLLFQRGKFVGYSGGYSVQPPRPGSAFEDLAIWRTLETGGTPKRLPAYGCATSRLLKAARDPLAVKYSL